MSKEKDKEIRDLKLRILELETKLYQKEILLDRATLLINGWLKKAEEEREV